MQTTTMKARFQIFGMYALGTGAAEFWHDFEATLPMTERMVQLSGAKTD